MSIPAPHAGPYIVEPLDPTVYKPTAEEATFLKELTGIRDDEELKEHVLEVQVEAYAVYPYPCIRRMSFLTFKLAGYPAYKTVLEIGKQRPNAVFLDLGCCFGNDARKAIKDGYPIENVLLCDIQPRFSEMGHRLFKTDQDTYPIRFLQGDIFDDKFLSPDRQMATTSVGSQPPSLDTLTSLTPLQRHVSVIHASSFFHLFDKFQQRQLAHSLSMLLSPFPGSIILGSHIGITETWIKGNGPPPKIPSGFAHSLDSWGAM